MTLNLNHVCHNQCRLKVTTPTVTLKRNCLVLSLNRYDIVVAGGHYGGYQSHTEIYNTATRKWRQGPTLPQRLSRMSSVQYEDTFLLVGGHNGGQYLDTIYQYNQSSETWILRPERLSAPKCEFGAVLAGPPVGDCPWYNGCSLRADVETSMHDCSHCVTIKSCASAFKAKANT